LGYDRVLCANVLQAFVTELMRSYKRRAKRHLGLRSVSLAHPGAVTMVQRSDSALRLNLHAHTVAIALTWESLSAVRCVWASGCGISTQADRSGTSARGRFGAASVAAWGRWPPLANVSARPSEPRSRA
jgi:hypothetical protein